MSFLALRQSFGLSLPWMSSSVFIFAHTVVQSHVAVTTDHLVENYCSSDMVSRNHISLHFIYKFVWPLPEIRLNNLFYFLYMFSSFPISVIYTCNIILSTGHSLWLLALVLKNAFSGMQTHGLSSFLNICTLDNVTTDRLLKRPEPQVDMNQRQVKIKHLEWEGKDQKA